MSDQKGSKVKGKKFGAYLIACVLIYLAGVYTNKEMPRIKAYFGEEFQVVSNCLKAEGV